MTINQKETFNFFSLKNNTLDCLRLSSNHSTLEPLIKEFDQKILLLDSGIIWHGTDN